MNKKTKIIIAAAAFALVFAGTGVYIATESNWFSPPIAEPIPLEDSASRSSTAADAISASEEEKYVVPPIPLPPRKDKAASSKPVEDERIVTENPDGTKNTEIVRPDFSKPEPPPPPKIDENQASDPTKEPEYTPEQIKPNEKPKKPETPDTPAGGEKPSKPNTPETPTGGETNNKGQVYVPGFGWCTPADAQGEVADFELSGDIIGY